MRMNKIVGMLRQGQEDLRWYGQNLETLKSEYNNQFVAFNRKRIIESDERLDRLLKKLESKRVDRSTVLIEFVSKTRRILNF